MSACIDVEQEARAWLRAEGWRARAAARRSAPQAIPLKAPHERREAALAAGGVARGEANPRARLTDDQVRAIRARKASGESSAALAAEFGITKRMANLIAAHQRWAHVTD